MGCLEGRITLVSGAGNGIGRGIAKAMAAEGAHVYLAERDADAAAQVASEIQASGGSATVIVADVTRTQDVQAALRTIEAAHGKLDILVNNAGLFLGRDFEDVTLDEWNKLVAVNLTGVWLGTKVCTAALKESGANSKHGSAIVNLASVAGLVGSQLDPLYSMTKGGVTLFTKSTALSYGRKGYKIRVNSIHPGVIETDMGNQTFVARASQTNSNDTEAARSVALKTHPIGRLGQPEDIASGICFLASDDAGFMTGSGLVVDGGLTAQ